MSTTITRRQAEQALAAVKAQFKSYVEDMVLPPTPAETINGVEYPATKGMTLKAGPPPVLMEGGFDGRDWTIVWEEGPDEWPFVLGTDEATEEERVLAGQAAEEFGAKTGDLTKSGRTPAVMPKGVRFEAINHYSIGLYPL